MAHAFLNAARPARVPAYGCSKKVYAVRRLALQAMGRSTARNVAMVAIGEGRRVVYHCAACDGWHVGHGQEGGRR